MVTIAEIRQKYPMYSDIPDGELVRGIHKKFYADMPYSDFLKNVDFRQSVDPTEGMTGGQKALAGAGKAFVDVSRGVKQITGFAPQAEIDEAKRLDAPLMRTGAGIAGNIGGNMALFAPTALIPGVNTYTGAGLVGAGMGAMQPVGSGESRVANTALGGVAGVGGQALGRGIGRVMRPVQSSLNPEEAALLQVARREGIPVSAGYATGSKPLQTMESVMENLPMTAGPQAAIREQGQRAFTRAALSRAGIADDVASSAVLTSQKANLGGQLGDIAKRNVLDFNRGLTDRFSAIVDDASQHLPPDLSSKVAGTVDQILKQVGQDGKMLGTNYQGWREPLRGLAASTETGRYFAQIRGALDDAFRTQLAGAEGETFRDISRQYANLKTIIDAMGGAGNLPAKGQIAPAQLGGAVGRAMGREGRALGRGDLNELSRAGQLFVRDQIPNSGTPQRQFIQNLVTGNIGNIGGGLAGGGLGYYAGGTPESAAMGAGMGIAGGLLAPRTLQMLMNTPAGQAYLTRGLLSAPPEVLNALSAAGRTALPAAALANY